MRDDGGTPLDRRPRLGRWGRSPRVLAGRYGALFTYAAAAGGSESAPGQLPAALMADLYLRAA